MRHKALNPLKLCILSLLLVGQALSSPPEPELTDPQQALLDQVNSLRKVQKLKQLEPDLTLCVLASHQMNRLLEKEGLAVLSEPGLIDRVFYVPDWDKKSFVVIVDAQARCLEELKNEPGFLGTASRPELTHAIIGVAPLSDGRTWTAVCLVRRLIYINPLRTFSSDGPHGLSDTTVTGTSSFPFMQAKFYRGDEDPETYAGKFHTFDFGPDETGYFELTLPLWKLGEGECKVGIYVKDTPDGKFRIAAYYRDWVQNMSPVPSCSPPPPSVTPVNTHRRAQSDSI